MTKERISYIIAAFAATVLLLLLARTLPFAPLRYLGLACGFVTVLLAYRHRQVR